MQVAADDLLDLIHRAPPRFPPLHVDDGAEGTLKRTAAAGIEAGVFADRPADGLGRQQRQRSAFYTGQILQVVVERLESALPRVAQDLVQTLFFSFAGKERDAEIPSLLQFGGHTGQHGNTARKMKTADAHLEARWAPGAR